MREQRIRATDHKLYRENQFEKLTNALSPVANKSGLNLTAGPSFLMNCAFLKNPAFRERGLIRSEQASLLRLSGTFVLFAKTVMPANQAKCDSYEVLGVNRSASRDQIKQAYRQLAL